MVLHSIFFTTMTNQKVGYIAGDHAEEPVTEVIEKTKRKPAQGARVPVVQLARRGKNESGRGRRKRRLTMRKRRTDNDEEKENGRR
jgi:hypothetical protein